MRYQDQVVKTTYKSLDDVCRAAQAVAADKLDWNPGGEARSILNQMQEIAMAGSWFLPLIRDGKVPEFDRHAIREARRLREQFDTLDKCIDAARSSTSELCQAIAEFPDSELEREMHVPFGGGQTMTMADILAIPSWNMIYHLGQINYVQLMLGDKEMH